MFLYYLCVEMMASEAIGNVQPSPKDTGEVRGALASRAIECLVLLSAVYQKVRNLR
jgi:hypothetical protein